MAMPVAGDFQRAQRRAGVELVADRVVRPQTRNRRESLLASFDQWLNKWSLSVETLIDIKDFDAERIAGLLVQYGRELYYQGRPYGIYSETINSVVARRPALRRQVAQAWDLAFAWVADEPVTHHPAMPRTVLVSIVGLALLWGWPLEASIFMMSWSGLFTNW